MADHGRKSYGRMNTSPRTTARPRKSPMQRPRSETLPPLLENPNHVIAPQSNSPPSAGEIVPEACVAPEPYNEAQKSNEATRSGCWNSGTCETSPNPSYHILPGHFADIASFIDPSVLQRHQPIDCDEFFQSWEMNQQTGSGSTSEEAYLETPALALSPLAIQWLAVWVDQHPYRFPSAKELQCLRRLADAPRDKIIDWLKQHLNITVQPSSDQGFGGPLQASENPLNGPRCLQSARLVTENPGNTKVFECTNKCGRRFVHKKDWTRHERINIEEWICPLCSTVLSRKGHLGNHMKKTHNTKEFDLKDQGRQFLAPSDRPCGFCGDTFEEWKAWLSHVGEHFKSSIGGTVSKISDWKERRGSDSEPDAPSRPTEGHYDSACMDDVDGIGAGSDERGDVIDGRAHFGDSSFDSLFDAYYSSYLAASDTKTPLNPVSHCSPSETLHAWRDTEEMPRHLQRPGDTLTAPDHADDFVQRMTALDLNDTGSEYTVYCAKGSDSSCSCPHCESRLSNGTSIIAAHPRATISEASRASGAKHVQSYYIKRWRNTPRVQDPWSSEAMQESTAARIETTSLRFGHFLREFGPRSLL